MKSKRHLFLRIDDPREHFAPDAIFELSKRCVRGVGPGILEVWRGSPQIGLDRGDLPHALHELAVPNDPTTFGLPADVPPNAQLLHTKAASVFCPKTGVNLHLTVAETVAAEVPSVLAYDKPVGTAEAYAVDVAALARIRRTFGPPRPPGDVPPADPGAPPADFDCPACDEPPTPVAECNALPLATSEAGFLCQNCGKMFRLSFHDGSVMVADTFFTMFGRSFRHLSPWSVLVPGSAHRLANVLRDMSG